MTTHHPWPKSHPGRHVLRWSRPLPRLPEARHEAASFVAQNPKWRPMFDLFERLSAEVGLELFGSVIMGGGLVLSVRSDVEHDEGVIVIYFDPRKSRFSLSYRHREVQPDQQEECGEAEIWERLRLFLAYKFGVHRKPEPIQRATDNDGASPHRV